MKRLFLLIVTAIITIPILFYGIGDLIRLWNRIHIKDEFYIEYSESCASIGMHNGVQGFLCDIQEAYWNTDSLIISGNKGCFLIEFGKTKYNDEMIEIPCERLSQRITKEPIRKYIKNKVE